MIYIILILLVITNLFWLFMVAFAVPGNWLMIIATCFVAWCFRDAGVFSTSTLIFVSALAVLGEVIEFFAGMGGARKAGASWLASAGAILGTVVGGVLGTILVPVLIIGTIMGACAGAAAMTVAIEMINGKSHRHSIRSGLGAGTGVLIGTMTKLFIGCAIWLTIAVAAFWP